MRRILLTAVLGACFSLPALACNMGQKGKQACNCSSSAACQGEHASCEAKKGEKTACGCQHGKTNIKEDEKSKPAS